MSARSVVARIAATVGLAAAIVVGASFLPGLPPVSALTLAAAVVFSAFLMLSIWSLERVFAKAGERPYKAWVPFYSLAVLYRISGFSPNFVWLEFVPRLNTIIGWSDFNMFMKVAALPLAAIAILGELTRLVVKLWAATTLSERFGKPRVFGVLFYIGVGFWIVGFDDSVYEA